MKKIGYQGLLDIGYRDGLYKLLDVNPESVPPFDSSSQTMGSMLRERCTWI
jgi:predicted ATP-grasp superfamily ATP-dependent carboligase